MVGRGRLDFDFDLNSQGFWYWWVGRALRLSDSSYSDDIVLRSFDHEVIYNLQTQTIK